MYRLYMFNSVLLQNLKRLRSSSSTLYIWKKENTCWAPPSSFYASIYL